MKKWSLLLFVLLIVGLPGCSTGNDAIERAMELRSRLTSSNGYTFDTQITADFGDMVYTFGMNCKADSAGNLSFTVTAPDTIAGISGSITGQEGKLTFGDTALAFELLAEGQLSPVSGPWVLVHTLHQGYLTACTQTESGLVLSINDRYEENALNLSVYLGADDLPTGGEIFWEGSRILSLTVTNFTFL